MPGGYSERLGKLPWGVGRPHIYSDFQDISVRRLVANLSDFAVDNGFTQILALTHVLRSVNDPWLPLDIEATWHLRNHLDKKGRSDVPIIYSLAIPYAVLRNAGQWQSLIEMLKSVPAATIWLRIENFGSSSKALAVQNYIKAANEFHKLGKPVIADNVGGLVSSCIWGGKWYCAWCDLRRKIRRITLAQAPRRRRGFASPRIFSILGLDAQEGPTIALLLEVRRSLIADPRHIPGQAISSEIQRGEMPCPDSIGRQFPVSRLTDSRCLPISSHSSLE